MKIMAGNSNLPLARAITSYLEIPLTDASVRRFADEEIFIEIHENVRGETETFTGLTNRACPSGANIWKNTSLRP